MARKPTLADQIGRLTSMGGPPKGAGAAKPAAGDFNDPGNFKQRQRRARRRLARVRLSDPKALRDVKPTARGNYTRQQRRAIYDAVKGLSKKQREKREKGAAEKYDPTAPLFGKDMNRELDAAERLRFGEEEKELGRRIAEHDEKTGVIGSAYDQYAKAVTDATARIKESYKTAADQTQGAVDKAFQDDSARVAQRDKEDADKAKLFGFEPSKSSEGAKAVEASRSQGNQAAGDIRGRGASANEMMEGRGTSAVQAKGEALSRHQTRRGALEDAQRSLTREKGDFRVDHRSKLRDSEREWAAIQKEFGLKEEAADQKSADNKANRALERQKLSAQKLIAKLYSSADKASARATVRVAKLQLEKGKISQRQYRHIINEYRGLPKKGKAPQPKNAATGKQGKGSGAGGAWAPWERQRIDRGAQSLMDKKAGLGDREKAIQTLVRNGYSRSLAAATWRAYVKKARLNNAKPHQNRTRG